MHKIKNLHSKKLREVAGAFATGITVVTTKTSEGNIKGMTANSFVSISLSPALVGFFVMSDGSFMEPLKINSSIGISILSSEQEVVSNQFAGFNKEDIEIKYEDDKEFPIIKNALAWYKTKVVSIELIGDHHFIVCSVKDLFRNKNKNPLLYYSGYKTFE